ncbi:hypothetical protein [Serratia sp. DD3]|uniref:hypothetical protein n=1 Tax=Serratia sp. DD3 TaxID=1410619 RepID=UPI0004D60C98|nr:hypothetical protein [Serratia sp. DD3]KEY57289.1 hypothetical protein SRDD_37820 [Serratia sp. DD3]
MSASPKAADILYSDYINSLSPDVKTHFDELQVMIKNSARDYYNELGECLFFITDSHPYYEDVKDVFYDAFVNLYTKNPLSPQEIPLLFIGFHVLDRINRQRDPLGFLLTDQAIYIQDDFSVFKDSSPLPRCYALPANHNDIAIFVDMLIGKFNRWKDWENLELSAEKIIKPNVRLVLIKMLEMLLDYHSKNNTLLEHSVKEIEPAEFIKSRNLEGTLLLGDDASASKKINKVIKKFKIPADESIKLALVDFPFFGGPYGMAFTDSALYTKDLLEDPLRIPFDKTGRRDLSYNQQKELRYNHDQELFIPVHIKESIRDELLDLLRQEINKVAR